MKAKQDSEYDDEIDFGPTWTSSSARVFAWPLGLRPWAHGAAGRTEFSWVWHAASAAD